MEFRRLCCSGRGSKSTSNLRIADDGAGIAAFGFVVEGFERLQRLFADYGSGPEYLAAPITLTSVRRLRPDALRG
jgi:hypothetical protein